MTAQACTHDDTGITPSGIEVCPWCVSAEMAELTRERDTYRDLYDAACAVLKTPDSTNDMGPGDLAEDLRACLYNHGVDMDDLMRQNDRLRAVLREVEWSGRGLSCPVCIGARQGPFKGHSESCRLAAALEGR